MNAIRSLQLRTYSVLFDVDRPGSPAKAINSAITWLIIVNLALLLLEQLPALYAAHQDLFASFERLSLYLFTAEYLLRLFAAGGDPKFAGRRFATFRFAATPLAVVDLIVIVPYWLHLLGIVELDLRVLRVLRLLRLARVLRDLIPAVQQFRRENAGKSIRYKIHAIMNDTPTSGRLHRQVDLALIFFIITSVLAVVLETVPSTHEPFRTQFYYFNIITIGLFTVEYLLRLYAAGEEAAGGSTATARWQFFRKPTSLIDLIAIAPFYLQFFFVIDLRFLRIFRILRVLKLTRYNTALKTFGMVLKRERRAFSAAMFVTVLITILSGAIVYEFEHAAQPEKFDTMPRAMYWAVITLASVGYGDISPITPIGQFLTMFLAMLGIGIVALPAGILGSAFSDQLHQQREEMVREFDAAFSDGMLTEEELGRLEEERVRLHLSEEQFEAMKQRAFAKHADVDAGEFRVDDMVDRVNQMKRLLDGLPPGLAVEKIRALPLSEKDKAALLVLLG
jgi:hypothetical protein